MKTQINYYIKIQQIKHIPRYFIKITSTKHLYLKTFIFYNNNMNFHHYIFVIILKLLKIIDT